MSDGPVDVVRDTANVVAGDVSGGFVQAGAIAGGVHFYSSGRRYVRGKSTVPVAPPAVAAARTLPHDIVTFTGRERELERLADVLTSARASGSVGIVAIDGMAGVGKPKTGS